MSSVHIPRLCTDDHSGLCDVNNVNSLDPLSLSLRMCVNDRITTNVYMCTKTNQCGELDQPGTQHTGMHTHAIHASRIAWLGISHNKLLVACTCIHPGPGAVHICQGDVPLWFPHATLLKQCPPTTSEGKWLTHTVPHACTWVLYKLLS